jgi:hypothetical protein
MTFYPQRQTYSNITGLKTHSLVWSSTWKLHSKKSEKRNKMINFH